MEMRKHDYKIEKEFDVGDYKCLIVALQQGHRCGYVILPRGHELEGDGWDDKGEFKVHGGISYAEWGILGGYKDRYVMGFDCSHVGDAKDLELIKEMNNETVAGMLLEIETSYVFDGDIVRDMEYVESELRSLVRQIREED